MRDRTDPAPWIALADARHASSIGRNTRPGVQSATKVHCLYSTAKLSRAPHDAAEVCEACDCITRVSQAAPLPIPTFTVSFRRDMARQTHHDVMQMKNGSSHGCPLRVLCEGPSIRDSRTNTCKGIGRALAQHSQRLTGSNWSGSHAPRSPRPDNAGGSSWRARQPKIGLPHVFLVVSTQNY